MMTKFNVGDKVRVLNVDKIIGGTTNWNNGDVVKVTKVDDNGTWLERSKPHKCPRLPFLRDTELRYVELAEPKPKKSARITALETQVAELQAKVEALESAGKYPLTDRFNRESPEVDGILADIERKAKPTLEALLATYPTPNEQRADVIKRAKAFVSDIVGNGTNFTWDIGGYKKQAVRASFHVNTEKGAVTALIHGHYSRHLYEKGIAKCDPDDVFNADIGKAIALARALGVDVPTEFVKAVQPTEVVVGQVVKDGYGPCANGKVSKLTPAVTRQGGGYVVADGGWSYVEDAVITDDTDAVYE